MNSPNPNFWYTSRGVITLCGIGFIAYFLFMEHRQHLAAWLPYGILLLCPLMHLFMHHGHHSDLDSKNTPKSNHKAEPQDRQGINNRGSERDE